MRFESLGRQVRRLWSAFTAFVTALCLMVAGTAQAGGQGDGAAQSSVTPGKVSNEV